MDEPRARPRSADAGRARLPAAERGSRQRGSDGRLGLERPLDLALYLLRDQLRWTQAAIERDIATGTERTVRITSPQPVYVLYWTASVGDDGHMEFHRDHYERDAALAAALR